MCNTGQHSLCHWCLDQQLRCWKTWRYRRLSTKSGEYHSALLRWCNTIVPATRVTPGQLFLHQVSSINEIHFHHIHWQLDPAKQCSVFPVLAERLSASLCHHWIRFFFFKIYVATYICRNIVSWINGTFCNWEFVRGQLWLLLIIQVRFS